MTAVPLQADITPTGMNQGDNVAVLTNLMTLCNDLKTQYTALLADVTALRTSFNTAMTKLNADAGVTDTNYAANGALTAGALTGPTISLSKG